MAYPDFYNVNANTSYPFVHPHTDITLSSGTWSNAWVVDVGVTFNFAADYSVEVSTLRLTSVGRSGNMVSFTFNAVGIDPFTITRSMSAPFASNEFVDLPDDIGSAYLVTGDLSSADSITDGTTASITSPSGGLIVEPGTIVTEKDSIVTSLNVYNTAATRSPELGDPIIIPPQDVVHPASGSASSTGLTGKIKFRPGYNMVIDVNAADRIITFTPLVSAGDGEPCETVIRYSGDLGDQGQKCSELTYMLGGALGVDGRFQIVGGSGVTVETDADAHTIHVLINVAGQIECYTYSTGASEPE